MIDRHFCHILWIPHIGSDSLWETGTTGWCRYQEAGLMVAITGYAYFPGVCLCATHSLQALVPSFISNNTYFHRDLRGLDAYKGL